MTVLEYSGTLLSRLEPREERPVASLDHLDFEPEAEPSALVSPELVLVASPEVADAAREALPEPVPFDEWLRRTRVAEARAAPIEWDWEFTTSRSRVDRAGAAFGLLFAAVSALPVLLLALDNAL
jgi:hypothetical protein